MSKKQLKMSKNNQFLIGFQTIKEVILEVLFNIIDGI